MRHGFYSGFAASALGGKIDGIGKDKTWGVTARVAASAVVGGTASAIGGGKFANGAVSGAFVRLFNEEAHPYRGYYLANEDSHHGIVKHGHAAAVVENPDPRSDGGDKVLYFTDALGADGMGKMEIKEFSSLQEARSKTMSYEKALEFRMTADQARAAIAVGRSIDAKYYDPTGVCAYNCTTVSMAILNAGGAQMKGSVGLVWLPNPIFVWAPLPVSNHPTATYKSNAGQTGMVVPWGDH